jgi:hypothetical protein
MPATAAWLFSAPPCFFFKRKGFRTYWFRTQTTLQKQMYVTPRSGESCQFAPKKYPTALCMDDVIFSSLFVA